MSSAASSGYYLVPFGNGAKHLRVLRFESSSHLDVLRSDLFVSVTEMQSIPYLTMMPTKILSLSASKEGKWTLESFCDDEVLVNGSDSLKKGSKLTLPKLNHTYLSLVPAPTLFPDASVRDICWYNLCVMTAEEYEAGGVSLLCAGKEVRAPKRGFEEEEEKVVQTEEEDHLSKRAKKCEYVPVEEMTEMIDQCSCGICTDLLAAPAAFPCGHVYCYGCIYDWTVTKKKGSCPYCRTSYPIKDCSLIVQLADIVHSVAAPVWKQDPEAKEKWEKRNEDGAFIHSQVRHRDAVEVEKKAVKRVVPASETAAAALASTQDQMLLSGIENALTTLLESSDAKAEILSLIRNNLTK